MQKSVFLWQFYQRSPELTCSELPEVSNGELQPMHGILTDDNDKQQSKISSLKKRPQRQHLPIKELQFGDALRIQCRPGFRSVGAETLKCLANQTLSGVSNTIWLTSKSNSKSIRFLNAVTLMNALNNWQIVRQNRHNA